MDESTTIFNENNYNFLYKSGLRFKLNRFLCMLSCLLQSEASEFIEPVTITDQIFQHPIVKTPILLQVNLVWVDMIITF